MHVHICVYPEYWALTLRFKIVIVVVVDACTVAEIIAATRLCAASRRLPLETIVVRMIISELCARPFVACRSRQAPIWIDATRRTDGELTLRFPHPDPGDYERFAPVHAHLVTNRLITADCFHYADASHALRIAADMLIAIMPNARETERRKEEEDKGETATNTHFRLLNVDFAKSDIRFVLFEIKRDLSVQKSRELHIIQLRFSWISWMILYVKCSTRWR